MSSISAIRPSAWLATLAFIAMALPMSAAVAPPTITKFAPTWTYQGQYGQAVTITGTNFNWVKSVYIGGCSTTWTVVSNTQISAQVPSKATSNSVWVVTAGGTAYGPEVFVVKPLPTPTIDTFAPDSAYVGQIGVKVKIVGTNFKGTGVLSNLLNVKSVSIGGKTTKSFGSVTPTSVTVIVPDGATTNGISVTTTAGTAYSSGYFTINPIPAPVITDFDPSSAYAGVPKVVTITGENFLGIGAASNVKTGVTEVSIGGIATKEFNVTSPTTIKVSVPPDATTNRISVTTSGGTAYSDDNFEITPIPAPKITSFTPSAYVGDMITIQGENFEGSGDLSGLIRVLSVSFGSISTVNFQYDSGHIWVYVPVGATSGGISVTTTAGTAYGSTYFTVKSHEAPIITSLSTTYGRKDDWIVITGKNLGANGTTSVRFNGALWTNGAVDSPTQITVQVPALAKTGPITVTTLGGTATTEGDFTVITDSSNPVIDSFAATSGKSGDVVDITGHNLKNAYAVAFNGVSAYFTMLSDTLISATVPDGDTTGIISVTTPYGVATSLGIFTSTTETAPVITGFTPVDGGAVGQLVTIYGEHFDGASAVYFNGVLCTAGAGLQPNGTILAVVPAGATTGQISVVTPYGTAYSEEDFYVIPAPTITSYTTHALKGGLVIIEGTNFTDGTEVWFGAEDAGSIIVWSAKYITVTVPETVGTGSMVLTLRTPGGHLHRDFTVE
ncbi:MAG: IPT/TIG domain-containing protein [Armatimonadota bacterium]